ncbi:hypothetical protein NDU88_001567 [Pleurodeles waltl]|uniref:Uncharacterized protein n=1 Tax=Pleurodeles waltl TaxID=8319 RepID=A0AAV7M8J3_PLEWA|nr:hypothetical protein NDU88_001567 [Pleurodeles waltl]
MESVSMQRAQEVTPGCCSLALARDAGHEMPGAYLGSRARIQLDTDTRCWARDDGCVLGFSSENPGAQTCGSRGTVEDDSEAKSDL